VGIRAQVLRAIRAAIYAATRIVTDTCLVEILGMWKSAVFSYGLLRMAIASLLRLCPPFVAGRMEFSP